MAVLDFTMKYLRTSHFFVGVIALAAFLLSGQYMHHFLEHLKGMPDGSRLLYRSAHIYLLWASLLNLLLGSYLMPIIQGRLRHLQFVASLMVLSAPLCIGFSFLTESDAQELNRPFARIGIYLAFVGCIMHAFISSVARRKSS